jgi:hypothetical protein
VENSDAADNTLRVAPNPTSGVSLLEYVHETEGAVRIDVTDMMGRVVTTMYNGVMQPQVFVTALPVQEWAPGAYTVRCVAGSKTSATRIVVTR